MRLNRRKPRSCQILQIEQLEQRTVLTAPAITSGLAFSIPENQTAITTVTATDLESPPETLTFSISGGADASRFGINPTTGALTFLAAPNFETLLDAGADNIYDVSATVDDGNAGTDTKNIAVTVTGINDNTPFFTSSTTFNVAENTTSVGTVVATDADLPAQTVTYTISGGVDAARFSINSTTGALSFLTAPNFEVPVDIGTDNIYNVSVTANDGAGSTTVQNIAVTVTAVNDSAPVFTSPTTFNVNENTTTVGTVVATDADLPANALTYSISGGVDATLFSINPTTGALTFVATPNFETPLDDGSNNVYNINVTANDGAGSTTVQNIAITVKNLAPLITSPATFNVPENTTDVGTVVATDPDVPPVAVTYSITGGADSALFSVNATTGVLSFLTAPNSEVPTDVGGNSVYNLIVTADTGGGGTVTQNIAVTVTGVNEAAPVFTSPATFNVAENTATVGTVVTTDADVPSQPRTYSISGGADAALFSINPTTGALTFLSAPDFETPQDVGVNNVYDVEVTAADGQGLSTVQQIAVTVTALNDNAPVFTSAETFNVAENSTAVGNITATDSDLPPQTLTYSISGGADAALFAIDPITGVLTFKVAPNFEAPTDAGADNVYNVTVAANDNGGSTSTKELVITVTDVVGTSTITVNPQTATYYLHKDRAFVSPTATFMTEATSTDFTHSKLVVSITNNRNFRDTLSVYPKGHRAGQIDVKGHRVLYGGTVIGRFHGGKWFRPDLEIKFNSSASAAAINQLVKRINFTADAARSVGETRTVQFQLLDPAGAVTASATRMIDVLAHP